MKILAVDSTTEACSVALLLSHAESSCKDLKPLELFELAPREHSQRLLAMVDQLLINAELSIKDIDAIAFGKGPGSFTGLRICLGLVQGLAFGIDVPVVPVSSLQALAQTALDLADVDDDETVVASIDARMNEIYYGSYKSEQGIMQPIDEERLCSPELFNKPTGDFVGVGSGWCYRDSMASDGLLRAYEQQLPRASAIARIAWQRYAQGHYCAAEQAQPTYLRDTVTWKKIAEQKNK